MAYYRKCCQSSSINESATTALKLPTAPQEPPKAVEQVEEDIVEETVADEASVEDKTEEAEVVEEAVEAEAAKASYNCCGVF